MYNQGEGPPAEDARDPELWCTSASVTAEGKHANGKHEYFSTYDIQVEIALVWTCMHSGLGPGCPSVSPTAPYNNQHLRRFAWIGSTDSVHSFRSAHSALSLLKPFVWERSERVGIGMFCEC